MRAKPILVLAALPRLRGPVGARAVAFVLLAVAARVSAQDPVFVDTQGVMRWSESGVEVALFGVNYTTPFAHAYRALGALGVDRRSAIDADVAHLARLGLDAFRVHVWEREVADSVGNLVLNDHLDLYDYLVFRLAERGIRTILTPIAWWETGYPERVPPTGAFTDPWSKGQMTTEPVAARAQARYVGQFVRHINPYSGLAYRDDPAVIAMELFNEPNHPGGPDETTRFIDTLADAARAAGWTKPVFYNISEGFTDEHGRAVCAAAIQGISMQWYPTGLVRGRALGGNMLPNVDRYPTPFDAFDGCADKARMVYEFDAADVAGSTMYPVMARSFRSAGIQFAAQFAYDPLVFAWANTEYQTHFVNLVHAPGKAVSLMIAAEVFRLVPRGASFPAYPEGSRFEVGPGARDEDRSGAREEGQPGVQGEDRPGTREAGALPTTFRVSYEEDLSEMVADTAFYHSNSTSTTPPDPAGLRHVAGVGSSPLVAYAGTGAYFLDRLSAGVWRLELYPDAVWVEDPFTRPSLSRRAVEILWETRPMRIGLPDLGPAFMVEPLDEGNGHRPRVRDGSFGIRPGVYLLRREGAAAPAAVPAEFHAPGPSAIRTRVVHAPAWEFLAGSSIDVEILVASPAPPDSVLLFASRPGGGFGPVRMQTDGGPRYVARLAVPPVGGTVDYRVTVFAGGSVVTFPGGVRGRPTDWDFTGRETWSVPVVAPDAPIVLFDAKRDRDRLLVPGAWQSVRFRSGLAAGRAAGDLALRAEVSDFGPPPHHLALRSHLPDRLSARMGALGADATIRVVVRSSGRDRDLVQIALVLADGSAWGRVVEIGPDWRGIDVPVAALEPVDLILLPRPYPQFLPYRFRPSSVPEGPDLSRLDGIQFAVALDLFSGNDLDAGHGFEVERVVLLAGGSGDPPR